MRLPRWELLASLGIGLAMIALMLAAGEFGLAARLEDEALNLRFRLRPATPQDVPVVIVAIDDTSIDRLGRWPWSRTLFANLLDRLTAADAKVVAFDMLFTEPQLSPLAPVLGQIEAALVPLLPVPAAQPRLHAALTALAAADAPDRLLAEAATRGTVILPVALDLQPSPTAQSFPVPEALARAEYLRTRGVGPDHLPSPAGVRLPAPLGTASLAHIALVPDATGAFHADYPVLRVGEGYVPSLSVEAVRAFLDVPRTDAIVEIGRGIRLGPVFIPVDVRMRMGVNDQPRGAFRQVSFADVLDGRIPPSAFAGRIVLVGATATGIGDVVPSPYDPVRAGVERHATLIANILRNEVLRRDDLTFAVDAAVILLATLAIGLAALGGSLATTLAGAAMIVTVAALDDYAFDRHTVWLNFTFPAAAIVLSTSMILGGRYALEWRRQARIRAAFGRYLHPDLVAELCRSRAPLQLGGEERELTVLFADISAFSTVAETLAPQTLVALMNEFFAAMTDAVLAHRGMLDKFIGDSLMAVFGAPLPDAAHAGNACRAALAMRAALSVLHARWRETGHPCLEMRIGINTGRMVIGNMGTDRRLDYTVMGDEVNVAARLENANRELGTRILISAETCRRAGASAVVRPCGTVEMKGRRQSVEAFELLGFA